jgi:hypothetical protein
MPIKFLQNSPIEGGSVLYTFLYLCWLSYLGVLLTNIDMENNRVLDVNCLEVIAVNNGGDRER